MRSQISRGTVPDAMAAAAEVGDRGYSFVDAEGRESFVPFRELVAAARRQAGALQGRGLARGDRIALIIPEHEQFIVSFLGSLAAGLVPVAIYPPFSLAKHETWLATTTGILRVAGASAIVTVDEVRALLRSAAARPDAPIVTGDDLATAGGDGPAPVDVGLDDLAFLQFTSGSTAAPRGVMVSHRNIAENCSRIMGEFLQMEAEDTDVSWLPHFMSWLPLYHDMGLVGFVLSPLFAVRPAVFLSTLRFLKRPSLWFELIHRHRATVTFAPNFSYALAARRIASEQIARWDLSCLRVAGCGSEPIAPQTMRDFAERFAPAGLRSEALTPCYGMAEATLLVTYNRVDEPWRSDVVDAERLRSAGRAVPAESGATQVELVGCGAPLAGHTVSILDERGHPLPERAVGEVELRGPSVTLGYFGDAEATQSSYRDGGLRTGDLGYLAEGQLFLVGRIKDLVIVHGRNYEPQTIEWTVAALPDVRAAGVVAFARPGERGTEEVVVACEVATSDRPALESAIRARVLDELALAVGDVVMLPTGFLPKTSSGKVKRAQTRQLYLDGTLQRVAAARRPTGPDRADATAWEGAPGSVLPASEAGADADARQQEAAGDAER